MFADFLDVARRSGAVEIQGDTIVKKRFRIASPLGFHNIRRDNPYLVILNEVKFLNALTRRLRFVAQRPWSLVRPRLHRQLLHLDQQQFEADYGAYAVENESKPMHIGTPFLMKRIGAKTGVLLIHGYMAAPEEVRPLGAFLHRHGFTVYACRLPGHGTSPDDLAQRNWEEWLMAVERGYLILANAYHHIVLGGFSCGANLGSARRR